MPHSNLKILHLKLISALPIYLLSSSLTFADNYYWCFNNPDFTTQACLEGSTNYLYNRKFDSPSAAAQASDENTRIGNPSFIYTSTLTQTSEKTFRLFYKLVYAPTGTLNTDTWLDIYRGGESCREKTLYNPATGECESPDTNLRRKEIGHINDHISCSPSKSISDPINIATGYNFVTEHDLIENAHPNLSFDRFYNGLTGQWTYSFSDKLVNSEGSVSVIHSDGKQSLFLKSGTAYIPEPSELGTLISDQSGGWRYTNPDDSEFSFDSTGLLTSINRKSLPPTTLTYTGDTITVNDGAGKELIIHSSNNLIRSITSTNFSTTYIYDISSRLTSVSANNNGALSSRFYHYESNSLPQQLTAITNENSTRSSSWTIDSSGRIMTSQSAGGAGLTKFDYPNTSKTIVTNELGKITTYHFQIIDGIKRITAIEGEPSANCFASNSDYTYNDRGQILTKTDAQGYVTTYTYNDRGLESSRTEAFGTPLARTTTTEWDPVRFLPTKITTPTQTTLYIYDDQGRQLSQQTTMTSAN